ncbi:hypothetical protein PG911_03060 [Tenacibaculum ovolyticum]|uniref:hypothetical protein n=1 Tax=Tenacibaculum ovolyticum TaxID=104270 RepID=UPI0022F3ED4B|nr:hypothetical protein [Tenacibaculum ovolyticum]WBX77256.1 hypothetical protein PG911_03060 [Tenacibaculum ovolyticum]
MSLFLVEAAKRLGADKEIMDSYWAYHEREQNWFFSPNPQLEGAASKPHSLPSSDSWKKKTSEERKKVWNRLSLKQRMTISTLAGFGYEGRGINLDSSTHYSKLQEAFVSRWRSDLYSVFWSDASDGKRWLCNVFVGDAIYLHNRKNFTSGNNHYYDPSQIYMGKSSLRKRNSYKDVEAGDVCVFGTGHVEIITSIQRNLIADDGFCSIGAGRGGNRSNMGLIKCDSFFSFGKRELDNDNHTYFHV